jgi:DNA-binding NarL/FixJ family response regulator
MSYPMHILLIDDHPLFRSGISGVISELGETVQITEVSSCEEALGAVDVDSGFALILLDLNLPGMDGMTGLSKLRDATPATPIVVLSASENTAKIKQAMSAGAKGYIPKSAGREIILNALRLVLSGGVYLPVNVIGETPPSTGADAESQLTPRQREVLRWVVRGKSNKEIASLLGMSENTVRVHVAAILKYLDVKNRTEAGFAAAHRGLDGAQD